MSRSASIGPDRHQSATGATLRTISTAMSSGRRRRAGSGPPQGWELARAAGITQTAVSALGWGREQLGVDRAKALAAVLRVHPAMLLFSDIAPGATAGLEPRCSFLGSRRRCSPFSRNRRRPESIHHLRRTPRPASRTSTRTSRSQPCRRRSTGPRATLSSAYSPPERCPMSRHAAAEPLRYGDSDGQRTRPGSGRSTRRRFRARVDGRPL